jgi:hypothetical protein
VCVSASSQTPTAVVCELVIAQVMATLEKMMGRGRKHTTPMLREAVLRAVHEQINLDDVDEVRTPFA